MDFADGLVDADNADQRLVQPVSTVAVDIADEEHIMVVKQEEEYTVVAVELECVYLHLDKI